MFLILEIFDNVTVFLFVKFSKLFDQFSMISSVTADTCIFASRGGNSLDLAKRYSQLGCGATVQLHSCFQIFVDRVRAGVTSSWLPRRLGGGLGQRQRGTQRFAWKVRLRATQSSILASFEYRGSSRGSRLQRDCQSNTLMCWVHLGDNRWVNCM